jgi:16S rRNA (guanine966-N2)-methyltransferase
LRHNGRNALQKRLFVTTATRNSVRIIAGRWRGRRVHFASLPGLRPSPDRVRETLFNWLRADLPGARCLDLFAGSGVLGLEALSRGAARAVFVDAAPEVTWQLTATLAELGATASEVVRADAFSYLRRTPEPFDLVFLDPPFDRDWLPDLCTLLEQRGWLAPRANVYLECAARAVPPSLPAGWQIWRQGRAGEVGYYLVRRGNHEPPSDDLTTTSDPL